MHYVTKNLLRSGVRLTPNERLMLANDLIESIDPEDLEDFCLEWIEELRDHIENVARQGIGLEEGWKVYRPG